MVHLHDKVLAPGPDLNQPKNQNMRHVRHAYISTLGSGAGPTGAVVVHLHDELLDLALLQLDACARGFRVQGLSFALSM